MTERLKVTEVEAERIVLRHPSGKGGRIELRATEGVASIIVTGPDDEHYPNVEIACDGERATVTIMDQDPTDPDSARIRAEMALDRFGTATLTVSGDDPGEAVSVEAGCRLTEERELATNRVYTERIRAAQAPRTPPEVH